MNKPGAPLISDLRLSRDAVISECGRYRYSLHRKWANSARMPVLWVMLNPSTADANIDDPTIRRCIAFSKAWGYGELFVGNVFSFRATDPAAMDDVPLSELQGPEHIRQLYRMARSSAITVAAWGAHERVKSVSLRTLSESFKSPGGIWCLGTTKSGAPRHPLYVKGDTQLQEWKQW